MIGIGVVLPNGVPCCCRVYPLGVFCRDNVLGVLDDGFNGVNDLLGVPYTGSIWNEDYNDIL
jgi:hypothetical protein